MSLVYSRKKEVTRHTRSFPRLGVFVRISAFAFLMESSPLALSVAFAQESYPPMAVGVKVIASEKVQITTELPGRISAVKIAEVRPRVSGIVERRIFEQGSLVREGDILFRLDRATYEIAVEAARAAVARAEAVLVDARQTERRRAHLTERSIASKAEHDTSIALRLQAQASLAETQAQLRAAEVNLGYTEIRAPITGRTGRALVTEGALVSAQGEVLTTIQQLETVYADMQQPVSELLALRKALSEGKIREIEPGAAQVVLYLDDGSRYPHPGKLLFSEASVERSSGQVTLRAEFPNPDGTLLPGMYVRVVVEQAMLDDAIAAPLQAVRRDNRGQPLVYVLNANSTAEMREVVLGRETGGRVIIESGLQDEDVIIIDGFQKIGPGAPVTPVCWADPAADEQNPDEVCMLKIGATAPSN